MLGYSIHENLTNVVRHSKRIIICLSANWNPSNVEFKLVWNSAVKKKRIHDPITVSLFAKMYQKRRLKTRVYANI